MGNFTNPIEYIDNKEHNIKIIKLFSSSKDPILGQRIMNNVESNETYECFFSENDEIYVTYSMQSLEVWDILKIRNGLKSNTYIKYNLDSITSNIVTQNTQFNKSRTFITAAFSSKYTISFAINRSSTNSILLYKVNTFDYEMNLYKELQVLELDPIENIKISTSSNYLVILSSSEIGLYDLTYNDNNNINPSYKADFRRRIFYIKQKIENFHTKNNYILTSNNKICIADDHVGLLNDFIITVKENVIELHKGFYTNKTLTCLCFSKDEVALATGSDEGEILVFEVRTKKKQSWLEKIGTMISSLSFSRDNKYLAYGNEQGIVGILHCKKMFITCIYKFKLNDEGYCKIKSLRYSNEYLSIAVCESGGLFQNKISNFTILTKIVHDGMND